MKEEEFEKTTKGLQRGDHLCLVIRGNYGNYVEHGELARIEHGRVYLIKGKAHSSKRIISISTR